MGATREDDSCPRFQEQTHHEVNRQIPFNDISLKKQTALKLKDESIYLLHIFILEKKSLIKEKNHFLTSF